MVISNEIANTNHVILQVLYDIPPYNDGLQPNFNNFVCTRNNGILFENELLQVGVKSEFTGKQGLFTSQIRHVKYDKTAHVDSKTTRTNVTQTKYILYAHTVYTLYSVIPTGKLGIFYGNKSPLPLTDFNTILHVHRKFTNRNRERKRIYIEKLYMLLLYSSQKQLPHKMKSRLVIIECAGYIFWQLFLWLGLCCSHYYDH